MTWWYTRSQVMTPCCPIMAQKLLDQTKFPDWFRRANSKSTKSNGGWENRNPFLCAVAYLWSWPFPAELQHTHTHIHTRTHIHTTNQTHTGALLDSTSYINNNLASAVRWWWCSRSCIDLEEATTAQTVSHKMPTLTARAVALEDLKKV